MDVSLIEQEFERSVPNAVRNMVSGEIVRMSLIEMQFIKKELLVAMESIDELMEANEFNFRVMVRKKKEEPSILLNGIIILFLRPPTTHFGAP